MGPRILIFEGVIVDLLVFLEHPGEVSLEFGQ
jgi:hypothetical protein